MQPTKPVPYTSENIIEADGIDLLYDPTSHNIVVIMQIGGEPLMGVVMKKDAAKDFAHHILHYTGADA